MFVCYTVPVWYMMITRIIHSYSFFSTASNNLMLDARTDHTQSVSILQRVKGHKVSQQSKYPPVLSAATVRPHYVWKLPLDLSCCPRLCALWPSFGRGMWPSSWELNTTALSFVHLYYSTLMKQRQFFFTTVKQFTKKLHSHTSFRVKGRFIACYCLNTLRIWLGI